MRELIKRVPLPISGLLLSLAALGNLLQSYSELARNICGLLSVFLLILLILKICMYFNSFLDEIKNPAIASVFTTLPMGIMLLTVYAKPFIASLSYYVWIAAILFNAFWILLFSYRFILKLEWSKVFASYAIVYSGIVVASVTAPAYEMKTLGSILFWFGFVGFIFVLTIGSYRYIKFPEVAEPAKPLIAISTAPLSLCIAGYMQSVEPKSVSFLIAMLVLAHILYVFSVYKAVSYLKLPFYPSYAAYTFPFVITAIASKMSNAFFMKQSISAPWFASLVSIETAIATIFVIYVFYRYMLFIFSKKAS